MYHYVEYLEDEMGRKDTQIKKLIYAPSLKERPRVEVEEDPGMGRSVSQRIEGHSMSPSVRVESSTLQGGQSTRYVHIVDKDIKKRLKRMESSLKYID